MANSDDDDDNVLEQVAAARRKLEAKRVLGQMRVAAAIKGIDDSCAEFSALGAGKATTSALRERLHRWAERTERMLQEKVSSREAKEFHDRTRHIFGPSFDQRVDIYLDFLGVLREELATRPDDVFASTKPQAADTSAASSRVPAEQAVFIVHGHDEANAMKLATLLRERFKLRTIVLKTAAGRGRTIIEKFEDEASRATFAFVLLSPDDLVDVKDAPYLQARPNVFFELGWFYGRLGRRRAVLVWKKGGQLPSDLRGIELVEFGDSVDEAYLPLEKELSAAGIIATPSGAGV